MIANLRRQYHVRILNYLLGNLLWRWRIKFGWISGGGGDSHARLSPEESIKHIENVFQRYRRYGGDNMFKGVCVEIGPGDSAGVGMLMWRHGAEKVVLVDRFRSPRDKKHQQSIYGLLADRYMLHDLNKGASWDDDSMEGIQWRIGLPAELFFQRAVEEGQSFDAVCSCAAMEHLYDPMDCLANMIRSLKLGGTMVHCIDFRDHGMFEPRYHPLKYLSIPNFIYKMMTRISGDQNRQLLPHYRSALETLSNLLSFSYENYIWMLVGGTELEPFRKREDIPEEMWRDPLAIVKKNRGDLSGEFAGMSDEDLAIAGICLVIRKH